MSTPALIWQRRRAGTSAWASAYARAARHWLDAGDAPTGRQPPGVRRETPNHWLAAARGRTAQHGTHAPRTPA
jgi:hypothetical protein